MKTPLNTIPIEDEEKDDIIQNILEDGTQEELKLFVEARTPAEAKKEKDFNTRLDMVLRALKKFDKEKNITRMSNIFYGKGRKKGIPKKMKDYFKINEKELYTRITEARDEVTKRRTEQEYKTRKENTEYEIKKARQKKSQLDEINKFNINQEDAIKKADRK